MVALLLPAFLAAAWGEVVETRTGQRFVGKIVREDDSSVVLAVDGGHVKLPKSNVRAIHRDTDSPSDAAKSHLETGDYRRAIEADKALLEKRPGDPEILARLGRAYAGLIEARTRSRRFADAQKLARDATPYRSHSAPLEQACETLEATVRRISDAEDDAQALVDSGRPVEAEKAYRRLTSLNPESADDYRKQIARALRRRADTRFDDEDLDDAAALYEELAQYDPVLFESVRDRYVCARLAPITEAMTASDRTAWPAHIKALTAVHEQVPGAPHVMYQLALCLEAEGDAEEARALYLRILGERASATRALDALRDEAYNVVQAIPLVLTRDDESRLFAQSSRQATTISTEHFRVRCFNESLAQRVARLAEMSYARIVDDVFEGAAPPSWPLPCRITIYPDESGYRLAAKPPGWASAVAQYQTADGELTGHTIDSYQTAPALLTNIIPHEIAHTVLSAHLGWPDACPSWIQEGIALRSEGVLRRRYFANVVCSAREVSGLLPIAVLAESAAPAQDQVDLFYAESFYLADFLLRRQGAINKLLGFARALSQDAFADALQEHFRMTPTALEQRYHRYLAGLRLSGEVSQRPSSQARTFSAIRVATAAGTR